MSVVPHSALSQYLRAFANIPQTETSSTGRNITEASVQTAQEVGHL